MSAIKQTITAQDSFTAQSELSGHENNFITEDKLFDKDTLIRYWKMFAEEKKVSGRSMEYLVLNQEVTLANDNEIEVKLSNSLQEEVLNECKGELVPFLRTNLQNSKITITGIVLEELRKKAIYTPKEKFNYLAEKNPLLLELKRRLALDEDL